jgi:hypothetical protein
MGDSTTRSDLQAFEEVFQRANMEAPQPLSHLYYQTEEGLS